MFNPFVANSQEKKKKKKENVLCLGFIKIPKNGLCKQSKLPSEYYSNSKEQKGKKKKKTLLLTLFFAGMNF